MGYKDFMNLYKKKCTAKVNSFLVIDTTLALGFRENYLGRNKN